MYVDISRAGVRILRVVVQDHYQNDKNFLNINECIAGQNFGGAPPAPPLSPSLLLSTTALSWDRTKNETLKNIYLGKWVQLSKCK